MYIDYFSVNDKKNQLDKIHRLNDSPQTTMFSSYHYCTMKLFFKLWKLSSILNFHSNMKLCTYMDVIINFQIIIFYFYFFQPPSLLHSIQVKSFQKLIIYISKSFPSNYQCRHVFCNYQSVMWSFSGQMKSDDSPGYE